MAGLDKQKILVIGGPTASGKTGLSVEMAKQLGGEIISADSMQIYRGLSIGTAKVTHEEMQGIPHHLIDILQPQELFSVADFVEHAARCIEDVASRGKVPIIAGGTGLYISSLVNGITFTKDDTDYALREKLQNQAQELGAEKMHQLLQEVDADYAKTVHPNNQKRVLRALELYYQTGTTMSEQLEQSLPAEKPYDAVVIGITAKNRDFLYQRINARVDKMVAEGVLKEAEYVYQNKDHFVTAAQAIGYKEFFPYFEKQESLETCVEQLKQASRKYAKRQLTWFNRVADLNWIYIDDTDETPVQRAQAMWQAQ